MACKIAWILPAVALAGCTNLLPTVDREIAADSDRVAQLKADGAAGGAKANAVVQYEDGLWIAGGNAKLPAADTLPPVFSQKATLDRTVASLAELAQRIALRSGLSVQVLPDAAAAAQRQANGDTAEHGMAQSAPPAGAQNVLAPPPRMNGAGSAPRSMPIRFSYLDGSLRGLLDAAASQFGVSWRYADGAVQFYATDTRNFQIRAIPGEASLSASVESRASDGSAAAGAGSGSGRNNAQATAVSSKLSVFDGIEKAVNAMLSPLGRAVSSPATGSISVTDTPSVLKRVAKYIDEQNAVLSRQVMINVTVLAVTTSDLDDYGINWDAVYKGLSTRFGVQSSYAAQAGATAFSAAILDTSSSKFAGSTLMMSALSSQGKVRRETSASVATLNNQPVPVQVARQTSYLKSSSTTQTANVGSTTSLEPGTVTAGFNMSILPHVLSDGTVMLQFSTDISSLRSIRTVTSGGGDGARSSIETPEVDTRNFLQRVAMKSGETLVISGFEQTDANADRKGVGHPDFFALGGGVKASRDKELIIILITPIALGGA
jgi:type IVB pilus formation R64 PilN family outer membrane protein